MSLYLTNRGLAISGNYVYVAEGLAGLQIIDISDPVRPSILGSVDMPGFANDITVSGDYAYIADGSSGIIVLDISDPQLPAMVGSFISPGSARTIAVSDKYACVGSGSFLSLYQAVPNK